MPSALNALDLLETPPEPEALASASLIVVAGDEPFLAAESLAVIRERLCPDEADRSWAWREFAGDAVDDPRDVFDEAATVPLFASATRSAVVRAADGFVSKTRGLLEQIAAGPRGSRGLVILEVRSLPSNTRLAKAVAGHGMLIEATIPRQAKLAAWLRKWAKARHGRPLAAATAERLLERLAGNLGQIDQAIARLAAAGGSGPIPPEQVDELAGSPREQSAWQMVEAAAAGRSAEALGLLDDLLEAGENPIGLTAQAAAVLRRLSTAARLLALPPGAGRPASLREAVKEAGVAAWPKALEAAAASLDQLGRRARALPIWLLETDRDLKGDASRGLRARLAIERLICKMAAKGAAQGSSRAGAGRGRSSHPR